MSLIIYVRRKGTGYNSLKYYNVVVAKGADKISGVIV